MTYTIQVLLNELSRVEENRTWTAQVLTREVIKSAQDLLQKHLLEYDRQIAEIQEAIALLEKTI